MQTEETDMLPSYSVCEVMHETWQWSITSAIKFTCQVVTGKFQTFNVAQGGEPFTVLCCYLKIKKAKTWIISRGKSSYKDIQ